ncbi:hypothetical protein [Janthinobacterium sp. J1-1]|uniref:hypothetical protein n=1 Tax=Janthinobacterium sp. J1-1 TaxID=3065910 RepID=UPI0028117F9F|nr:hypothetical protein [Janthinobacterium sp. J1-1]
MRPGIQVDQSIRATSSAKRTRGRRQQNKVDEKTISSLTWGLTIISSISLMLTLLGYGVAMAVETTFGLPHQAVYSSVLDLIGLSVYALISLILEIDKIRWWSIFEQFWKHSLFVAACIFFFVCCVIYLRTRQARTLARIHRFWHSFKPTIQGDSISKSLAKGAIGSILFGGFMLFLPSLIVGALLFIVMLISIVPIFGSQLGTLYFLKFVITPTTCEPVRSSTALQPLLSAPRKKNAPTVSTANCVALFKDKTRVAIGRVVVSTPAAIVLFEPVSGSTWRVPIGELTILPVAHVPPLNKP